VPAQRFYERAGLSGWGDEFESYGIPHVVMWRMVEARSADESVESVT
jgi:predicted GNAT family N-acyltransferase